MSETTKSESTKPVQDATKETVLPNRGANAGNDGVSTLPPTSKPVSSYYDDDSDEDLPIAKLMAKVQVNAQQAQQPSKPSPKAPSMSSKESSRSSKEGTGSSEKSLKKESKDRPESRDKDRSKSEKKDKKERKDKEREKDRDREKKERREKERVRTREDDADNRLSKRRVESSSSSSKPSSKTTTKKSERRTLDIKTTKRGARDIDPDRPLKDQAIEAILVRWQYAMQWEPRSAAVDINEGWMELPGMIGVTVGVHEETLGDIRDLRPKAPRPSYDYLSTLPSKTLRDMWRTGLEKQMEALIQAEGESSDLLPVLKDELRTVDKFDYERADRHWARSHPGSAASTAVFEKPSDSSKQSSNVVKREDSTKPVTKEEKSTEASASVPAIVVAESASTTRTKIGVIDDDD